MDDYIPPLFLRKPPSLSTFRKQGNLETTFKLELDPPREREPVVPKRMFSTQLAPGTSSSARKQARTSKDTSTDKERHMSASKATVAPLNLDGVVNTVENQRLSTDAVPHTAPALHDTHFSLRHSLTSRSLERRYRDKLVVSDGTRNLTQDPTRAGRVSKRWADIDAAWSRPFESARQSTVPVTCATFVRPPFPPTRDFRNDSSYSPARRVRTARPTASPLDGAFTRRETELQRVGEFAREPVRVRTAGVRVVAWNYHWEVEQ